MHDSELILAFLTEGIEMLDDAEPRLMELQHLEGQAGSANKELINSIFRLFHSIKGSAGFLQFSQISAVTHEAETLLDLIRKDKLLIKAGHMDILCKACDLIRKLLGMVEENNVDTGCEVEVSAMVSTLERLSTDRNDLRRTPEPVRIPIDRPVAIPPPMTESQKANLLIDDDDDVEPAASPLPDNRVSGIIDKGMLTIFIADAEDLLEHIEQALMKMEGNPANMDEVVHSAFRSMHTLKGNCGLLQLSDMQQLSHKAETVLECMREGRVPAGKSLIKLLLKIVDLFRKTIADVGAGGVGRIPALPGFSDLLSDFIPADSGPAAVPEKSKPAMAPAEPAAAPAPVATPPMPPRADVIPPEPTPPAPTVVKEGAARVDPSPATGTSRRDIRVSVDKLDHLSNLVGELVIAETMVTHSPELAGLRLEGFERSAHRLSLITTELQDLSMSLRMVPLDATMKKMIRLVHDLSAKAGKRVDLQLVGTDTEVDRTVAEMVSDPLVHMVRNSVDHGLESPDERRAAGKPETGTVTIEARHQSGEIWIIISDDGRGLNRNRILAKGIERGLVREDQNLRDEDIYALIFEPGFSTADKITDVSGRGVGMDVVKKNMEKVRGRIEIESDPGIGTTFTIRIPLTLAIIQGMLMRVGDERYIIPLLAIRESIRPDAEMVKTVSERGEMLAMRGEMLPLFRLSRLFNIQSAIQNVTDGIAVIIEHGGRSTALLVDELLGQQQTVVKSLEESFGRVEGVSGASILADGSVGLILDVAGLVKLTRLSAE